MEGRRRVQEQIHQDAQQARRRADDKEEEEEMVEVRVHRMDKSVELPKYAKQGDAAFDLRASEDKTIPSGQKAVVKTSIRIAVPEGYCGLIWDRSGMAAKHGIHCLNRSA
jgi:dUTP pyrophosphatase